MMEVRLVTDNGGRRHISIYIKLCNSLFNLINLLLITIRKLKKKRIKRQMFNEQRGFSKWRYNMAPNSKIGKY